MAFLLCRFVTENGEIQERALSLLYIDSNSSYNSLLLKVERPTIEKIRLRRLAIKVFET